ncbi:hypothetical protein [Mesorhizobium sp. B1-1-5]|uniref:hypothetical protein n=1 Tax=Mesorhizobium sp. B1-1-5 TaxID=2589979 RepID=UPI0015E48911|nr:hypothetical protein [Mesorhizobium sp. B1-1-5]
MIELVMPPLIPAIVAFAGQGDENRMKRDIPRKIGYDPGVLESGSHGRPPRR